MEQATTTVYAQGGRGYNRLIAWEGEKTMTFTVTDALMSPMGLAVLTGAGIVEAGKEDHVSHVHVTFDLAVDGSGEGSIKLVDLQNELGIVAEKIEVCTDIPAYATVLDHNGAIVGWVDEVTLGGTASATLEDVIEVTDSQPLTVTATGVASETIKLDFYVRMGTGVTEVHIAPESFGGAFYVEADTLYRNQDGKDMAATLTFPKVKIQSGFTMAMAPTGDPSELMRLAA